MSVPKDKAMPEQVADAGTAEELAGDIPARGRGAPKKDPSQKLTNSIRVSFTQDEYFKLVEEAAHEKMELRAWARRILLREVGRSE